MKKFLRGTASSLVFFSLVFLAGCPDAGVTVHTPEDPAEALVNTFWAGESIDGDWLTIAFLPNRVVAWTYMYENIWRRGIYTFNAGNEGVIGFTHFPNPIPAILAYYPPPLPLAPNGFSIDGGILTVNNYRGEGVSREFRKVRGADPDEEIPVPFANLDPLADNLAGSVWAGVTPAGASAWMTLSFRARGTFEEIPQFSAFFADHDYVAVISYAHDSTSAVWNYTPDTNHEGNPTAFFSIPGHRLQGSNPQSLGPTTGFNPTTPPGTGIPVPGIITGDEGQEIISFPGVHFHHGELTFRRYR